MPSILRSIAIEPVFTTNMRVDGWDKPLEQSHVAFTRVYSEARR
jgi:hypothetical protein